MVPGSHRFFAGGYGWFFLFYFDLRAEFGRVFHQQVTPWIDANPYLGSVVFLGIYIVAVVVMLPASIVTIAGGVLFGPLWGFILVSAGSTAGAALAFLGARFIFRERIEEMGGERLDRMQEGIRKDGWRYVAFTRLIPLFPFNLLNYLFGLTRIRFGTYVLVSWIAMMPGGFAYVYAGYASRVAAVEGEPVREVFYTISIALGLLVLASFLPRIYRAILYDPDEDEVPEGG